MRACAGLHLGAESYFVAAQQQSTQQQSTQSTAVRTSLSLSQLQAFIGVAGPACKMLGATLRFLRRRSCTVRRGRSARSGSSWPAGAGTARARSVRARPGRLRGRSNLRSESVFCGTFARARGALDGPKQRFSARAERAAGLWRQAADQVIGKHLMIQ